MVQQMLREAKLLLNKTSNTLEWQDLHDLRNDLPEKAPIVAIWHV